MTSAKRLRVQALLRLAMKVAPPERATWFEAMAMELNYVPDAKLSRFAIGCLTAAVRATIAAPAILLATARWLLIGGPVVWAAVNIRFAGRMSLAEALSLEVFAYSVAAIFISGAIATARAGFKATVMLGTPFMVLLGLAALIVKFVLPQSPATTLYLALIAEDLVVLTLALLVAFGALRLVAAKQVACG